MDTLSHHRAAILHVRELAEIVFMLLEKKGEQTKQECIPSGLIGRDKHIGAARNARPVVLARPAIAVTQLGVTSCDDTWERRDV
jgi:hypothetical protein